MSKKGCYFTENSMAPQCRRLWGRMETAEAHVAELARVLAHLLEFADSTGQGCAKQVEEARTALAATPANVLERAKAKDEALSVLRGYYNTKFGQLAMVKQVGVFLATLDALGETDT